MSSASARIRAEIESAGGIPFDRFMDLALYDPDAGYFASGEQLRSDRGGDFLTSPEVSPFFGETLGEFVIAEAERLGTPPALIEAGAGSGSLLEPLLGVAREAVGEVFAVEVSPAARSHLASRVSGTQVVASLDEVGRHEAAVVLANELVDNLPAAVAVRRGGGWAERWVVVEGAGLGMEERPARSEVAAWAERHAGPVAEAGVVEVQLAAARWLEKALAVGRSGAVVVVDYGDTAEGLAGRRTEGTVRTYLRHHLGPDPLFAPGGTDITMDVDFGALSSVAMAAGATAEIHRQDEFLVEWGLRRRIDRVRDRELEEARSGEAMERLRLRSLVTGGETLLHPRGLGDFRVLVARW